MIFGWGVVVRRSTSKFVSVCGGRVRSISNLARNSSPLCPLLVSSANDQQRSKKMLLRLIDSEISSALQTYHLDFDEEQTAGISDFTIEDDGGKSTVTLTRDYQGEHTIVVVGMPYLDPNDDDEDNHDLCFPYTVKFTKKSGLNLMFSCASLPVNGTSMLGVSVMNRGDSSSSSSEEDDQLATELSNSKNYSYKHSYLDRIIDTSAKISMHKYMTTGTRKYVFWLKDVKKFLEE